ncbi:MAG: hypothetical protein NTX35_00175 [Verrucomicrobia bacterium]|nr:hypothetical protein [Verrucomicrobiota bacterium]
MNARFRFLFAVTAFLPLASCEKPVPPAVSVTPEAATYNAATESQLAEARDALQRQALEIETKTALMDKQLAEMEQALKDRENAELRDSLEALRQQNEALRAQADTARQQSNAVTQRIANTTPRVNVTPQVSAPRDHSLFYEQLAPYGRWMDVSGYGYCWRPTLTMARWKPYVDGCWVWSSMGWTWQSNEPFGWATYHYGRWVNLSRHGWVWVPGSEWAPAWVSWRQSRDHVGWAPLPPDRGSISGVYRDCDTQYNLGPSSYTFITTNHFVQPSYTTYCAPATQNTTIFQSSVNVTQIVRCDDQPRRGMFQHHGGPPRAQMERDCARPVPQIQVQSIAAGEIPRSRPGHRRPEALAQPVMVELPLLSTDVLAMRPQMAERVDKPRRVDGFEGVPQRVATEIRETIATEKLTAAVQQPVAVMEATAPPVIVQPVATPATVVSAPVVEPASSETVRPAMALEDKPMTQGASPIAATQTSVIPEQPAIPPAVISVITAAAEPETTPSSTVVMPAEPGVPAATVAVEATPPAEMPASQPSVVQTTPAVTETSVPQPNETPVQQPAAAEKMAVEQAAAAEAEKARMQAEVTAMQQRQQEELAAQQRAMAENKAAELAQAAAEAERARQQAEAAAMQRQQEEAARRAQEMALREAEEQARRQAEAEMRRAQEAAERRAQEMARQQAEEQARRAAEEQMRQQQEMAQRQAEEQARRAAEEQMRRAQEEAQRAAQEAAEAAQRAADNAARNQPQTGG